MAEQSVTLAPAMVTTLSTGMTAGTTVYNGDPVAAVWVSANPMPGPGSGMRIGPKGSLSWTSPGPLYGAVDAGVTAPVTLTLSSNVGSLVNPVDVGAAVAAQLLAKGVPNVLTGAMVYNGALPAAGRYDSGEYYFDIPVDMSAYASISVDLYLVTAATIRIQWLDPVTGVIFSGAPFIASGVPVNMMLTQTVKAPKLRLLISNLTLPITTYPQLTIYATNRILPEGLTYWDNTYTSQIASQAWAAGQQTNFPDLFKSKGGPATLRLSSGFPTTTAKGFFGYRYYDAGTLLQSAFVLTTGTAISGPNTETEVLGEAYLPPGSLQLFWQNSITAATYEIKATITMGG